MMPHVLESESWEVLEKQIDLYEMEKKDIISKGCLKGKTGKGNKKKVNYTDQSNDWAAENEWTANEWNTDNDWGGDWGNEQSSEENAWKAQMTSGSIKLPKTEKKGRKVKKGEVKEKGKGNLRANKNTVGIFLLGVRKRRSLDRRSP